MFKTLTSFIAKPRTLNADLSLDHIELANNHLIIGLHLTWINQTPDPIEIRGVSVKLFNKGKKEKPIQLIYNGRFARIPYQKTVTKIAGATSFHIDSEASQVEYLRFLTYEILDLATGTYAAELHSTVSEGTYVHDFQLKITPQVKLFVSGQECEKKQTGPGSSSVFSRALRFGVF